MPVPSYGLEPKRRPLLEQTLMAAIGFGELASGKIYTAPELGRRYSATSAQVRASLRTLAVDGLVTAVPGRGFYIAEPTTQELSELVELRLLIEVPTARKAAEFGLSDQECSQTRWLAEATMTAALQGDLLGYIRSDLDFHLHLVALGGNTELVEVIRVLRIRSRIRVSEEMATSFMKRNAEEHLAMAEMLAIGDGPGLDDILRCHVVRGLE